MRKTLRRLAAEMAITAAQLRYYRHRMVLAVFGVVLAVVLIVLLVGLGYGVTTAGTEGLDWLGQDLWVSGASLQFAPGTIGGVDLPLEDSHTIARDIEARDDVASAEALSFQAVYVSTDRSDFETIIGIGMTGNGSSIGWSTRFSRKDAHWANGTYDGPMTREVIVSPSAAEQLNVSPGESLYIGAATDQARENEFTVVGSATTLSTFLGAPTVTLPLGELQEISQTTRRDKGSFIVIDLEPTADPEEVQAELEREYPDYTVRTNRDQLQSVIGEQGAIVASAIALVVVALAVGTVLVVNVLGMLVIHQREELATLNAIGVRHTHLTEMFALQGLGLGVTGGLLGIGLAALLRIPLNQFIRDITGFAYLIKTPWWVLAVGFGIAVIMGLVGSAMIGWRVARLDPVDNIEM